MLPDEYSGEQLPCDRADLGSRRSPSQRLLVPMVFATALYGCNPGTDAGMEEERMLATIDAALDEAGLPADLLARQQRLFEVLAEDRIDELPQYLDLTFRFNDLERPVPAAASVGSRYVPAQRERPGLNYYQFLARAIPDHDWTDRTLEVVWSYPSIALIVAHRDEKDPVFTQWSRREDGWKVVSLTINNSDETLQRARESRRPNR